MQIKKHLNEEQRKEIREMYQFFESYSKVAKTLGLSYKTVWNVINPDKAQESREKYDKARGNPERGAKKRHLEEITARYFS